tara:strand:+ start:786 stop:1082 length:297 start_codon:yes stop_codon:yes gene_type:complete
MGIKIDTREVDELFKELSKMPTQAMKEAYPFLKSKTPIQSGNARSNTRLNGTKIKSDYAYAGRLDEGWSKQAPDGFTEPTLDELENIIDNLVEDINNG